MENLKKLLIQKINVCDDDVLLNKLLDLFSKRTSRVQESEINYKTSEKSLIPEWHLEELRQDREKRLRGEMKVFSEEESIARIKKKLDELQAKS